MIASAEAAAALEREDMRRVQQAEYEEALAADRIRQAAEREAAELEELRQAEIDKQAEDVSPNAAELLAGLCITVLTRLRLTRIRRKRQRKSGAVLRKQTSWSAFLQSQRMV
jgi:hypothetical protein